MKKSKVFLSPRSRALHPRNLIKVYRDLKSSFGFQNWWPGETQLEICIGAILTQNTAWRNVEKAIINLKRKKLLSLKGMDRLSHQEFAEVIKPAGYFNIKTRRIKKFVDHVLAHYEGNLSKFLSLDTQNLRKELLSISGIGKETADSIILYAARRPIFVIDAYTKRIFSRHRLIFDHRKVFNNFDEVYRYYFKEIDYDDWRMLFEKSIPRNVSIYNDFHAQIVHIGKTFCRTSTFLCANCPLGKYI